MKKLWLALILTSHYSLAVESQTNAQLPFQGKPAVMLQVFDISKKAEKAIPGNKLSISKKQNKLCWGSVNVPLQGDSIVAEAFYAPAAFKVISPDAKIDSSEDMKNHTIVTEVKNLNTPNIYRCWQFTKTDPIGIYKMEIQINDQVFRGLEFEIVK